MYDFLIGFGILGGVVWYLYRQYQKQPTAKQIGYYQRVKFNGDRLKQELIIINMSFGKFAEQNDLLKRKMLADMSIPITDIDEYAKDSLEFPGLLDRRSAIKWLASRGLIQR